MKIISAGKVLAGTLIPQHFFLILTVALFVDIKFRGAYGGSDLFSNSYLTSLIILIIAVGSGLQLILGIIRICWPKTSRTWKPFLRALMPLLIIFLFVFAAKSIELGLLSFRVFSEKSFGECRKHARPVGDDGFFAWCESRDQSGPVGSFNMMSYILYDSTNQMLLPYAERSFEWKKTAITHKYRSAFTAKYTVEKISGHFYLLESWMDEKGGDPVDSDLPQGKLKYCPGENPRIISVCPGQDEVN